MVAKELFLQELALNMTGPLHSFQNIQPQPNLQHYTEKANIPFKSYLMLLAGTQELAVHGEEFFLPLAPWKDPSGWFHLSFGP